MNLLKLHAVSKRYGSVAALDNVDLKVPAGGRTAIVGPSGSGKTTLLRVIAGFEAPDTGRVILGGQVLADGHDATPAYRRDIGVVMQDGALFPHLSIADNIGFGLERSVSRRRDRIAELMQMVELDIEMLDRRPDALSGGQQQRVALARALARKPRLMLLDEPFAALDTGLRASTRRGVADLLGAAGITTILVTHDPAEALSFADQVVLMGDGKLLQVGAPRELYLQPDSPMIAELLGDAIILPALLVDGRAECALGHLAITDAQRRGAAHIMLRPEQISLMAVRPKVSMPSDVPRGEVVDIDFGGAICTVTLRLLNAAPHRMPKLALRQAYIEVPAIGTIVHLIIVGEAHVFKKTAPL